MGRGREGGREEKEGDTCRREKRNKEGREGGRRKREGREEVERERGNGGEEAVG